MAKQEIIYIGKPLFAELPNKAQELLVYPLIKAIQDFYKNPENQRAFEVWKSNKRRLTSETKTKRATISTDQSEMATQQQVIF